ncbi:MAG: primosomal protein N' [Eubacteriales bacterium]|nr:primosomal protein N' [Eubacteriales bacterium]
MNEEVEEIKEKEFGKQAQGDADEAGARFVDYPYIRVFLIDVPFHIDKPYLYYIPTDMRGLIHKGSFIIVPFGGGNRRQIALVTELLTEEELQYKDHIKPVLSLLYEGLSLDNELLGLCLYLHEYTFCTVGEAARTVLPSAAFGRINEYYSVLKEIPQPQSYSEQIMLVYNFIKSQRRATAAVIKMEYGDEAVRILSEMEKHGLITRHLEHKESGGRIFSEHISLAVSVEEAKAGAETAVKRRSPKQSDIINELIDSGDTTAGELKVKFGEIQPQLKALTAKGLITVEKRELFRDPYAGRFSADKISKTPEEKLSEAQSAAYDEIIDIYNTGLPKAVLLHGITGSGKTHVIKALADAVIADRRGVILLVPEIALTPQTVQYFGSCYGERIAVIHSSLSAGERFDTWRRIKRGDVDLCIGTRSAIFAPFSDIGMIVIDEEQEHTYKSDMNPKYHARDVARYRCARHNALMLLSSATPSIESYYKAETGVYTLVELNERYGSAKLPDVKITDMRNEAKTGNVSALSECIKTEIQSNLNVNEQVVLFLNRRGYNNFLQCPCCGNVIMCPHCSVSLTYHTFSLNTGSTVNKGGFLSCHYCGYRKTVSDECPVCHKAPMVFMGYGTQKVEEELNALFPDSRILRMDADTTGTKFAFDEIVGDFKSGEADILLGTQMIVKGHDFPNVTLSGVLSADSSLFLDDYRANERTFAMVCQLLGRSGRGETEGRAVIQTYNPDHPIIKLAAAQDYKSFYKSEISIRRALIFPPFCDIALITLISEDEKDMENAGKALEDYIKTLIKEQYSDIPLQLFGPFEAPVYKVNEKYRMRVVIKCRLTKKTRMFLRRVTAEFNDRLRKKILVTIDINPSSL